MVTTAVQLKPRATLHQECVRVRPTALQSAGFCFTDARQSWVSLKLSWSMVWNVQTKALVMTVLRAVKCSLDITDVVHMKRYVDAIEICLLCLLIAIYQKYNLQFKVQRTQWCDLYFMFSTGNLPHHIISVSIISSCKQTVLTSLQLPHIWCRCPLYQLWCLPSLQQLQQTLCMFCVPAGKLYDCTLPPLTTIPISSCPFRYLSLLQLLGTALSADQAPAGRSGLITVLDYGMCDPRINSHHRHLWVYHENHFDVQSAHPYCNSSSTTQSSTLNRQVKWVLSSFRAE